MSNNQPSGGQEVSGWAAGGVGFAACVLTIIGVFQVVAGLTAIFDDEFFVVTANYTFEFDTTVWGWLHLILGVVMVSTGMGLFVGKSWAAVTGIFLATLSAIANFFFIPYYPFWSLTLIALYGFVIWGLCVVRRDDVSG